MVPKHGHVRYAALTAAGFFVLLPTIVLALFYGGGTWMSWQELQNAPMLLQWRLARLLLGLAAGGALAVSGCAYQAVLRNPLAEPYVLGISGGASLGAATVILCGWNAFHVLAVPSGAFLGGIAVLATVLWIGHCAGRDFASQVLLCGVVAGSTCGSILMFLISVMGGTRELNSITWWLLGSLQIYDATLLPYLWGALLAGSLALFLIGERIDVLTLGEEQAACFGIPVRRTVLTVLGIASLLSAMTVCLCGIIGFAGLIVPHVLRKTVTVRHRDLFALCLFWGGLFLVWCDLAAQSIFPAREIPVGVMTAFLGGPFFLWLLGRRRA